MRREGSSAGLTLVEVLVALVMLGIMSAAIVGTFSLTAAMNRDAAADVNDSRTVRSATERIKLEWSDPDLFDAKTIGTTDGLTVDAYIEERLGSDCAAEVVDDPVVPAAVRVVRITCQNGEAGADQVYEVEFGRP